VREEGLKKEKAKKLIGETEEEEFHVHHDSFSLFFVSLLLKSFVADLP
jgi:hypothetical protein